MSRPHLIRQELSRGSYALLLCMGKRAGLNLQLGSVPTALLSTSHAKASMKVAPHVMGQGKRVRYGECCPLFMSMGGCCCGHGKGVARARRWY